MTTATRTKSARQPSTRRPTGLSLFSGAGGMDLGAADAGIEVLACGEMDHNACDTLRWNHAAQGCRTAVVEGDIAAISPHDFCREARIQGTEIDVLFGGPPCQTFSQIGKQASLGDPRGQLLFQMVEYARFFNPKLVIIENVAGLVSAKDLDGRRGGVLDLLIADLRALKYTTTWGVLNSADFGVPQNRKRTFVVASRVHQPVLPQATHHGGDQDSLLALRPYTTVREALRGLGSPTPRGVASDDSHVDVTPEGDRRRIAGVPEGEHLARCTFLPAAQRGRLTAKDTTKFLRLGWEKQANTLRGGEIFFHPTDDRYLTPREYMRLHGYPDEYRLVGPIRGRSGQFRELDQHRLVANSVPPPLARAVFQAALVGLGEHGQSSLSA